MKLSDKLNELSRELKRIVVRREVLWYWDLKEYADALEQASKEIDKLTLKIRKLRTKK